MHIGVCYFMYHCIGLLQEMEALERKWEWRNDAFAFAASWQPSNLDILFAAIAELLDNAVDEVIILTVSVQVSSLVFTV